MRKDEKTIFGIYICVYALSKIMVIPSLEDAGKIISILSDFVLFYGVSFLILKNTILEKRWVFCLIGSIIYSFVSLALKYYEEGIVCLGVPTKDFITSLYFSIVTVTTLGYGDCYPSESTRFYAALQAIHGVVMFGTVIAIILHVFNNAPSEDSKI